MNNSIDKTSTSFANTLLSWYNNNQRDLPWRKTTDAYKIWLSEVILQQTRVAQGLPYYLSFVQNFPSVNDLAAAPEEKVLRIWQGLGYYSRAKNLHKCAQLITRDYNGVFPKQLNVLLTLPGIGPYTAAAIASICFNEPVAVVDGNVYRVLARFYGVNNDISSSKGVKTFQLLANEVMSTQNPQHYNQAIMEFGAIQCTPKNPKCTACPLSDKCYAYTNNYQSKLPVKLKKSKVQDRYFYYVVIEQKGKVVMTYRNKKDIWQGLYDFPVLESKKKEAVDSVIDHIFNRNSKIVVDHVSKDFKHILSHQRIYGCFIKVQLENNSYDLPDNGAFYSKEAIHELPKPVLINNYLNETFF